MAIDTSSNTSFIEANVQSTFIYTNLKDADLPESFYRDVSDFPHGTTLNIPTVGSRTLQDVSERKVINPTGITSGNVTLVINKSVGDAYYVTDDMREDSFDINGLLMQNSAEQVIALQAERETTFLEACNDAQTVSDQNQVNGFDHRWIALDGADLIALDDFRKMKVSFQKALNPQAARIALVDGVVAATLEGLFTTTASSDFNIHFEGMVTEGFSREHKFVRHIFGWDIWETERLDAVVSETISTSVFGSQSASSTDGVANIFLCLADDNHKAMAHAWRRKPRVETKRELRSDVFEVSSRYGFGNMRDDTLGVIITSATGIG